MAKWEVSAEVTLFDDAENRSALKYADKMEIMMGDERNEPADGRSLSEKLEEFIEFGKTYKFTVSLEEL